MQLINNCKFNLLTQQKQKQTNCLDSNYKQNYYKNLFFFKTIKNNNLKQLNLNRSNTIPFNKLNLIFINNKKNNWKKIILNKTKNLYNNKNNKKSFALVTSTLSSSSDNTTKMLNINNNNNNQKFAVIDINLFSSNLSNKNKINNYFNQTKLNNNNNNFKQTTKKSILLTKNSSLNNSFGENLTNFLPFIDSSNYTEEQLKSTTNFCLEEKNKPYLYSDSFFINNNLKYFDICNSLTTTSVNTTKNLVNFFY